MQIFTLDRALIWYYNITMEQNNNHSFSAEKFRKNQMKFYENKEDNFSSFFAFTNENLAFLEKLNLADKDVLSVTGSGDHILNSAYFGAKSIESFDINSLAALAYDLKANAVMHLTLDEFLYFYGPGTFFDKKLYDKISPYLKPETRQFFDEVMEILRKYPEERENFLINLVEEFEDVRDNFSEHIRINPYLASKQTFAETKRRLENLSSPVVHKLCPIDKIGDNFEPKDIVLLSNILEYFLRQKYENGKYNMSSPAEFNQNLRKVIKDNGVINLMYDLSFEFDEEIWEKLKIASYFIEVPSAILPGFYDKVILAQKNDIPTLEK